MDEAALQQRWNDMRGLLDERQRRAFAASEARSHGAGGVAAVMRATGLARATIAAGLRELDSPCTDGHVRRPGGGRIPLRVTDPVLAGELHRLLDNTGATPRRPPSLRELSEALTHAGHRVSHSTVARMLRPAAPETGGQQAAQVTTCASCPPGIAAEVEARHAVEPPLEDVDRRAFVAGLAKGLSVIDAFDHEHPRLTIAQVAAHCALTRAAARRYLLTLQQLGYVEVHHAMFALTPKVMRLGQSFLYSSRLPQIIQPELLAIATTLQEASSAGVLDGDDVISIAATTAARPVSSTVQSGTRVPAYCTANGRVLLSAWPEDVARHWLARQELKPRTCFTITSEARLLDALARTRELGYATVDQEFELGLRTIAVPLFDHRGATIASLNVSVHASRTTLADLQARCLPALRAAQSRLRTVL